jgi:hypothetical protein
MKQAVCKEFNVDPLEPATATWKFRLPPTPVPVPLPPAIFTEAPAMFDPEPAVPCRVKPVGDALVTPLPIYTFWMLAVLEPITNWLAAVVVALAPKAMELPSLALALEPRAVAKLAAFELAPTARARFEAVEL